MRVTKPLGTVTALYQEILDLALADTPKCNSCWRHKQWDGVDQPNSTELKRLEEMAVVPSLRSLHIVN